MPSTRTATVLQLSDTHLSAERGPSVRGLDADERLHDALTAWTRRGERADLVLLTGDNADDASPEAYQRLLDAVIPFGAPVLAVAGNHDEPLAMAATLGPLADIAVGAWRVVGLDSSIPGEIHGSIDARAVAAALDDGHDGRPTLVAVHHPPRSASTHPWFQLLGGEDLLAVLAARPQVRLVVSGHLHEPFRTDGPGGLTLLGAPSTLRGFHHDGPVFESAADTGTGARVLHLHPDGTFDTDLVEA